MDQPDLDKFAASVNSGEMLKQAERTRALIEEFNRGAAVSSVSPADIKQLWVAHRRITVDIPPEPGIQLGLGVVAAYGVQAAADPVRFTAVRWRHTVLSDLVERGVLNAYVHDGEPQEKVFAAAATIPLTKEDIAEVTIPKTLAQAPADFAAKARAKMQAEGYDPVRPTIDAKFIRWLQEKC